MSIVLWVLGIQLWPSMYHRSQDSILSTQVWPYMANIPGLGEWRRGNDCQKYEIIGKKRQEFYQAQYEGKTTFMVKMVNEKILLFHYFNKDRTGKVTRVAGILAKAKQLTKDEMTQYMDFVEEIGIEDENVQRVLDTDTCPKKIKTR
ncbi:probasin-like isoform X2 [Microtus pennsylvanicus]|uniref:probasin-like isoform X2 n=1 Tax=Microtus pennsylvanicus TaxID=10058 RepID=UPI003F6D83FB